MPQSILSLALLEQNFGFVSQRLSDLEPFLEAHRPLALSAGEKLENLLDFFVRAEHMKKLILINHLFLSSLSLVPSFFFLLLCPQLFLTTFSLSLLPRCHRLWFRIATVLLHLHARHLWETNWWVAIVHGARAACSEL
jgi:hypothetical protein